MSPHKDVKFPPLTSPQTQRLSYNRSGNNDTVQTSEGHEGAGAGAAAAAHRTSATRKLCWTGSSYIYATTGRKPQLLTQLESFVNKELKTINPDEPNCQELKLQVYRSVFGCFIRSFKTYQPLLAAVKKEYENSLACQQDQIQAVEPLRSHLQLLTEECDRKIQAHREEEQAEIRALKREKQQLQQNIDTMREKEKASQTVVDHLQSELSNMYLQYREERDARKLLIWELNDLMRSPGRNEHPVAKDTEGVSDCVRLRLALKVCREDLAKAQEELTRVKAEYWDVVPRLDWDALEERNKHTLQQLKTLESDFSKMKCEYDTLLELHKKEKTRHNSTVQADESAPQGQSQIQPNHIEEPLNCDVPESGALPLQESRDAPRTEKSDEETDEHVASDSDTPRSAQSARRDSPLTRLT